MNFWFSPAQLPADFPKSLFSVFCGTVTKPGIWESSSTSPPRLLPCQRPNLHRLQLPFAIFHPNYRKHALTFFSSFSTLPPLMFVMCDLTAFLSCLISFSCSPSLTDYSWHTHFGPSWSSPCLSLQTSPLTYSRALDWSVLFNARLLCL